MMGKGNKQTQKKNKQKNKTNKSTTTIRTRFGARLEYSHENRWILGLREFFFPPVPKRTSLKLNYEKKPQRRRLRTETFEFTAGCILPLFESVHKARIKARRIQSSSNKASRRETSLHERSAPRSSPPSCIHQSAHSAMFSPSGGTGFAGSTAFKRLMQEYKGACDTNHAAHTPYCCLALCFCDYTAFTHQCHCVSRGISFHGWVGRVSHCMPSERGLC
jgi:hypothetical protein